MKTCPDCGGVEFSASQKCYCNIIVDGENDFLRNDSKDDSVNILEADKPYGPYQCLICRAEFESLCEDLDNTDDPPEDYTIVYLKQTIDGDILTNSYEAKIKTIVTTDIKAAVRSLGKLGMEIQYVFKGCHSSVNLA